MRENLNVLLATDVFPPRCGGSGWSTYHLARALTAAGHTVVVARPQPALPAGTTCVSQFDGLLVHELGLGGVNLPLLRGFTRQELFWPRFGRFLGELAQREAVDLIHAQHLLSIPAAVRAGRERGVPVVATVRDYWPVCPTGIRLPRCATVPRCSPACQVCCLAGGRTILRPAVWSARAYIAGNLRRRQRALRAADRVVAVSAHVARVLRVEIPGLNPIVIPNFIDLEEFGPSVTDGAARLPGGVLYVGKLERHKGADLLPEALAASPSARLIVAGTGPLRSTIARECADRDIAVELRGEVANRDIARLMRSASLLLFPARWEEPLARTLLEAGAAGLPVVALATGGTPEIVQHGVTGLLVDDPAGLAGAVSAMLADEGLRRAYGARARAHIEERFSRDAVLPRVEPLYREVIATRRAPALRAR